MRDSVITIDFLTSEALYFCCTLL